MSRKHNSKTDTITVPLAEDGSFLHTDETFVNEHEIGDGALGGGRDGDLQTFLSSSRLPSSSSAAVISSSRDKDNKPHIVYDLTSDDGGFSAQGSDITLLWKKVYEAVSAARYIFFILFLFFLYYIFFYML